VDEFAMVTAHRVIANAELVLARLIYIIGVFARRGVNITGISGGAAGGDTLWAKACYEADRPFVLAMPNIYYEEYYDRDQEEMDWLFNNASRTEYVVDREDGLTNWRDLWKSQAWWKDNFARNKYMVNEATVYIAVSNLDPTYVLAHPELRGGTNAGIRDIARYGKPVDGVVTILWINPATPEKVYQVKINKS
jgi:hypothetical protein